MNDKTKIIILLIVVAGIFFCMYGRGDKSTSELYNDTNKTVSEIKDEHRSSQCEVNNAAGKLETAGQAISGVISTINECQTAAERNRAGIKECEKLVKECIYINEENRTILSDIGKAAGAGESSSAEREKSRL